MTGNRYVAVYDRPRVERSGFEAAALRTEVAARIATEAEAAVAETVVVDLASVEQPEAAA